MSHAFGEKTGAEQRAFDVESLATDHGVVMVSAVRAYGNLGPFRPENREDFKGIRLFDILLRPNQILCSSTVMPDDCYKNLYGRWGVIIGSGTVQQAFPYDAITTVVNDTVESQFLDRLEGISPTEQMMAAIYGRDVYNEINVRASHIAGLYYCIDEGENPNNPELPSERTQEKVDELNAPLFVLRNGRFHKMDAVEELMAGKPGEALDAPEVIAHRLELTGTKREEVIENLVETLTLAPRNAVTSGMHRGQYAYDYRAATSGGFDDFMEEQERHIDAANRLSRRIYGAVALHAFAEAAEKDHAIVAENARYLASSVIDRVIYRQHVARVLKSGNLRITREDFEHYLATSKLPEYLADH